MQSPVSLATGKHSHISTEDMKKTLIASAILGLAGFTHAQTTTSLATKTDITFYGDLDIGVTNIERQDAIVGRGDNNKIGIKGSQDVGSGLSAVFQLEARYEPDTGTTESATARPLFQGESRAGLKGAFGTVQLGRALTAVQNDLGDFQAWGLISNRANLGLFAGAGYNSDPLNAGSSQNRFSNGLFYNSPVVGNGFQANASVATKEALGTGTPKSNPYSLSGIYSRGPASAMVGFEQNAINTTFWTVAGAYVLGDIKLMGSYAQQKLETNNLKTNGATISASYKLASGAVLAGYGNNKPDNTDQTDQYSLGYQYNFNANTFLYTDGWTRHAPGVADTSAIDVGIHIHF